MDKNRCEECYRTDGTHRMTCSHHPMAGGAVVNRAFIDPVSINQSKHVGADGKLRYNADGSLVYPGATGVRKFNPETGKVEE